MLASVRTVLSVTSFSYALELLTEVAPLTVRSKLEAAILRKVEVPATTITVAPVAPVVSIGAVVLPAATVVALTAEVPAVAAGASVQPPAVGIELGGVTPSVTTGAVVDVPTVAVSVTATAPVSVGASGALLDAPSIEIGMAVLTPSVATGASVLVPESPTVSVAVLVPSLQIPDPNFSSVSLLLHMDGANNSTTFIDSSSAARTITVNGNAKISTAQSKFGGASGLFDGTGDWLTATSDAAFTLDGDFTIEFWLYINTMKQSGLLSNGAGSFSGTAFVIVLNHGTQTNKLSIWNFPSQSSAALCATGTVSTGTWHHAAFVRSGSTLTSYLNGVGGTSATTSATFTTSATNLRIGRYWSGDFDGYIDELRITKGVARYTSAFTPPSLPFPDS